jgi:hypothetical protein
LDVEPATFFIDHQHNGVNAERLQVLLQALERLRSEPIARGLPVVLV